MFVTQFLTIVMISIMIITSLSILFIPVGYAGNLSSSSGTTKTSDPTENPSGTSGGGGNLPAPPPSSPSQDTPNTSPSIEIIEPDPAEEFVFITSTITVTVEAHDDDGFIDHIDFLQDGVVKDSVSSSSIDSPSTYVGTWDTTPGIYQLTAEAFDNDEASTLTDPVSVRVDSPPSVNIVNPENNYVYAAEEPIDFTVNAADSDGTIQLVNFYYYDYDYHYIDSKSSSPFTISWSPSLGGYLLIAEAYDNDGAMTTSDGVFITDGSGSGDSLSILLLLPPPLDVDKGPSNGVQPSDPILVDPPFGPIPFHQGSSYVATTSSDLDTPLDLSNDIITTYYIVPKLQDKYTQFTDISLIVVTTKKDFGYVDAIVMINPSEETSIINGFIMLVGDSGLIKNSDIISMKIEFKMKKSWLTDNKIDPSSIHLAFNPNSLSTDLFSNSGLYTASLSNDAPMQTLQSAIINEDDLNVYYQVETQGYLATFTIVGQKVIEVNPYQSEIPEIPWTLIIGMVVFASLTLIVLLFKAGYIYREEESINKTNKREPVETILTQTTPKKEINTIPLDILKPTPSLVAVAEIVQPSEESDSTRPPIYN